MRTCEVVDTPASHNSGYRDYFLKLKQKPLKQQVIQDFEIKFKVKDIKKNELLTSHYSCILGTYSTRLNFEKEENIKSLFKIKHIINLEQNYLRETKVEEKVIKVHNPSDYWS